MSAPRCITRSEVRRWLKRRPKDAHKGTSGRVLLIAGSKGMTGAAVLAAAAAIRSGAGLVRLATVKSQQPIAAKRAPLEATVAALSEDRNGRLGSHALRDVKKIFKSFRPDVVAFGPGVGVNAAARSMVKFLARQKEIGAVIDADGLNALAEAKRVRFSGAAVLTPHVGEAARLLNTTPASVGNDRAAAARRVAEKFSAVCLLKGPGTLITDGTRTWRNATGNPAMASGGMGDALTGIVAAFWAQQPPRDRAHALTAAAAAAFVHGWAADLAVKKFPERTLTASDVIATLPKAFKKIWRWV